MDSLQWQPISRNYILEKEKCQIESNDASNSHPLLAGEKTSVESISKDKDSDGPLAEIAVNESSFIDPLSGVLQSLQIESKSSGRDFAPKGTGLGTRNDKVKDAKETGSLTTAWGMKLAAMRREFSSVDNIHVRADFLGEDSQEEGFGFQPISQKFERTRVRLEQLESKSLGIAFQKGIDVSFEEYSGMLDRKRDGMKKAWQANEKVQALKLVIQASKMLGDGHLAKIYPAVFVMVANILDEFSDLVFERIKEKAELPNPRDPYSYSTRLPENFSCQQIPEAAKETYRNWLYKVSCIRELLPRMMIEMALLKCSRFLSDDIVPFTLDRLTKTIRGVGDPLVALYARCYLAHVGVNEAPDYKRYLLLNFHDYLVSLQDFRMNRLMKVLENNQMSETEFFRIHAPALEWILRCVGKDGSQEMFEEVLHEYKSLADSSTLLLFILEAFPSQLFQQRALDMITLIKNARPTHVSVVHMFKVLGDHFATHPPPKDIRLLVLNEVWKVCTHCKDLALYVSCASSWLEVLANHYQGREVMILLGDVVAHVDAARDGVSAAARELEQLVLAVVRHCQHLGAALLTSDYLTKILDTFKLGKKAEICKDVLENFIRVQEGATTDPILIHTIFDIARTLHDSVDDLSPEGDQRHISGLICGFIDRIDFRRDLEQQLNIYVECRAAFPNLDQVKCRLVVATAGLAVKAHRFVKGKHSKKTAAFVKACLAYCHITIPSIDDIFKKLHLLQLCGHVALINHCLPQTDSFFKAAISLVAEVPPVLEEGHKRVSTETKLTSFLQGFMGGLVVVPGHPEHGAFYLITGLLNAINRYPWQKNTGFKTTVHLSLLNLLCAYYQKRLPYSVQGVDSNDLLYAQNQEYMDELKRKIDSVMQAIISQLTELGEGSESAGKSRQAHLVLDFLNEILGNMYLAEDTARFSAKLLELAKKIKTSSSAIHYQKTITRIGNMNEDCCPGQNLNAILMLKKASVA